MHVSITVPDKIFLEIPNVYRNLQYYGYAHLFITRVTICVLALCLRFLSQDSKPFIESALSTGEREFSGNLGATRELKVPEK